MNGSLAAQRRLRLAGFVLLIGCLWGVMYALYPVGLQRAGPFWLAALRFDVFWIATLLLCLATRTRLRAPRGGEWVAVLAYGVFNVVLHNLGMIAGARFVPVAVVGIAAGVNPILTVLLSRFLRDHRPWTAGLWLALGTGLAGVSVLAVSRGRDGGLAVDGWALVVVAGVAAWSVGSVVLKGTGASLPMLGIAFWGSAIGALLLQGSAFLLEPPPALDWTFAGVVVYLGVVGGLAAFLMWMRVVRLYGPQQANLVSFFSPVATSAAGFLLLGQPIGAAHLVSYALVSAGLFLAVRELAGAPRTAGGSSPDS